MVTALPVESAMKLSSVLPADELSASDAQFLAALGKRVRELREQHGMTRKHLARAANVSERYLGQLESGEGNISIILLRHIASALTTPLSALLSMEDGNAGRRRRIALIGLRGAGKTSLGALLAQEFHVPFLELDQEIEREAGLPLSEIFTLYGQSGYRRIERRCLENVLRNYPHTVIAAGGGIVSEEATFALLLTQCHTVWLKATPAEHMARVIAQGDLRPMAGNTEAMEDLKRILADREPLYQKADVVVDTSGQTLAESFRTLRSLLKRAITAKEDTHGNCG